MAVFENEAEIYRCMFFQTFSNSSCLMVKARAEDLMAYNRGIVIPAWMIFCKIDLGILFFFALK